MGLELDNLGIADRGGRGKWVMCDLDGLRVLGEDAQFKTLGKSFRSIMTTLVNHDVNFFASLAAKRVIREGWKKHFDSLLTKMRDLFTIGTVSQKYQYEPRFLVCKISSLVDRCCFFT